MKIAIINYPQAMKSAIFGLDDLFSLANRLCIDNQLDATFDVEILGLTDLAQISAIETHTAIVIPPSINSSYYLNPENKLAAWLTERHNKGSILCSACAGAFLIAQTGLLNGREATTHWQLVNTLEERFPEIKLNPDKILINHGDIITAGGVMSWIDLSLELVEQLASPTIMRQLGKILVVDTGRREQRYYQQFSPKLAHGDEVILQAQKNIQSNFNKVIKVSDMAKSACLTERTFLRRFSHCTGLNPSTYIQRLRVQKACDLLETTKTTFEVIANSVGYEDTSACRKAFVKVIGLTPRDFRKRFVSDANT